MSKAGNKPSAPVQSAPAAGGAAGQQPAAQQQQQVTIDESKMVKAYANFCRVTPGYEELIIDFGLSPQPIGAPQPSQIGIDQRIIVNYYMAKRLLHALAGSVQRYEQIFGVMEIDVQKRVQQPPQAANPQAARPPQT